MKLPDTHEHKPRLRLPLILIVAVAAVGVMLLPVVRSNSAAISITVTNNSQRQIRHLYLAPGDPNNWGPDQLNGSTINPGASFVLSGVDCTGSTTRVIAEDHNGCFVYYTASCDGNQTWQITDNTTPDCGS
jgi:hypothetical protein